MGAYQRRTVERWAGGGPGRGRNDASVGSDALPGSPAGWIPRAGGVTPRRYSSEQVSHELSIRLSIQRSELGHTVQI